MFYFFTRAKTLAGILTSCSIDYFSRDPSNLSYAIFLWATAYVIPLSIILYSYVPAHCVFELSFKTSTVKDISLIR